MPKKDIKAMIEELEELKDHLEENECNDFLDSISVLQGLINNQDTFSYKEDAVVNFLVSSTIVNIKLQLRQLRKNPFANFINK